MTSQRVKSLLKKHGPDFFSRIGKKGFEVTTERHFGGDRKAHVEWLKRKGWFTVDSSLSYAKPGVFSDPGPHPSHLVELRAWLEHAESNMTPYNGPDE